MQATERDQKEILQWKSTLHGIKNVIEAINTRIYQTEESVSSKMSFS